MRPPARRDTLLRLRGRPLPRPVPGERGEPAHQLGSALDQRHRQPPRGLLPGPALQHRVEQRGSGRSGTAPSTSTRAAVSQPNGSRTRAPPARPAPTAHIQATRHKRISCHILSADATRRRNHRSDGAARASARQPESEPAQAAPPARRRPEPPLMHPARSCAAGCIKQSSAAMTHAAQRNLLHHSCIRSELPVKQQVTGTVKGSGELSDRRKQDEKKEERVKEEKKEKREREQHS